MALTKNYDFNGIAVPNAYMRVILPAVSATKTDLSFSLTRSVNAGSPPFLVESFSSPYDLNGKNPFTQAYDYLKTLSEFEGAVNVLEEGQTE